jgi:hypothetical protein
MALSCGLVCSLNFVPSEPLALCISIVELSGYPLASYVAVMGLEMLGRSCSGSVGPIMGIDWKGNEMRGDGYGGGYGIHGLVMGIVVVVMVNRSSNMCAVFRNQEIQLLLSVFLPVCGLAVTVTASTRACA